MQSRRNGSPRGQCFLVAVSFGQTFSLHTLPPSPPCGLRDLVCLDELAIGCPECSLSVTLFKSLVVGNSSLVARRTGLTNGVAEATILLVQFDSSCIVKDSTTSSIFAFSLLRQTMFPMPGLFLLWWFGFSREPIDLGR